MEENASVSSADTSLENLSDRELTTRAINRAECAIAQVGVMASDWDAMVRQNHYLSGRVDALQAQLRDMRDTLSLVTEIVLRDA